MAIEPDWDMTPYFPEFDGSAYRDFRASLTTDVADLQAEAAVGNLMADFEGKTGELTYKAELICIVDTLSSGMLVSRTERKNLVLPSFVGFHWAKRAFEWWYLRQYR